MIGNRDLTPSECVALERLMDDAGLSAILEALSTICGEKAEHIRTNWPDDRALARKWDTASGVIGVSVANLPHPMFGA